jgi:hypothetical protein
MTNCLLARKMMKSPFAVKADGLLSMPVKNRIIGRCWATRGAAHLKTIRKYLIARRPGRLIFNLVDTNDINYVPAEIIDAALDGVHENIVSSKVLVHCNQGMSRSPAIAFLYLLKFSDAFHRQNHDDDLRDFLKIYPAYAPARGMADYVKLNWVKYSSRG